MEQLESATRKRETGRVTESSILGSRSHLLGTLQ